MSILQKWLLGIAASLVVILISTLAAGAWNFRNYVYEEVATKDEVIVAGAQAQFSLIILLEQKQKQLGRLEAKRNKDREDYERIKWLREDIERTKQMIRGKK